MKTFFSLLLCASLAASGCATTFASQRSEPAPGARQRRVDPDLMADYVEQIPVGSRVKITSRDGKVLRATLMKNDANPIVVQRRTRIPEPPLEVPLSDIIALELDVPNGNIGRNVAIVAGTAAGATLGVLMVLAALFAD